MVAIIIDPVTRKESGVLCFWGIAMNEELKKYYEVLGIGADATDQEVYDACGGTANSKDYAIDLETARDGRFIAYDNGTVLDTGSGLMWAAKDNGSYINWQAAKRYCENYHGGGYTDWRMPTQDELAGLYDKAETYMATEIDIVHLTRLIRITSFILWASETAGSDATSFSFYDGRRFQPHASTGLGRALPVRYYHKECLIKQGGHLAESYEIPKDETSRASTIDLGGHSKTPPPKDTEGKGFPPGSSPKKSTVAMPPIKGMPSCSFPCTEKQERPDVVTLLRQSEKPPSREGEKRKIRFSIIVSLGVFCALMLVLMAVFFWPTIPDDNISSMGKIYPPRINKPTGKSVIVPPLEDTKLKGQTEILSVLPVPSSVTKKASADQDVKPTTILPIEEKKLKDQTEEISAAAPPNVTKNGKYAIQIIAYPEARKKDAMVFAKDLRKTQPDVYVERVNIRKRGVWYRILTGHFTSIEDATNYMKEKKILEAHPGSFIQLKSAVRSRLEGDNVYP